MPFDFQESEHAGDRKGHHAHDRIATRLAFSGLKQATQCFQGVSWPIVDVNGSLIREGNCTHSNIYKKQFFIDVIMRVAIVKDVNKFTHS